MNLQQIGLRIKQCREKQGYTQQQFADKIGITPNYLSDMERGKKFPSIDTLVDIINALNVSADDVFMDVINEGYKIKASKFGELIATLPYEKQRRIFAVVEVLINEP